MEKGPFIIFSFEKNMDSYIIALLSLCFLDVRDKLNLWGKKKFKKMKILKFLRLEDTVRELQESTAVLPNSAMKCKIRWCWGEKLEEGNCPHTA